MGAPNSTCYTDIVPLNLSQKMLRNVRLFGVYKVFTKRIFLPLITIYASQGIGLSISEIGVTAAAGSVASILFETMTGY